LFQERIECGHAFFRLTGGYSEGTVPKAREKRSNLTTEGLVENGMKVQCVQLGGFGERSRVSVLYCDMQS